MKKWKKIVKIATAVVFFAAMINFLWTKMNFAAQAELDKLNKKNVVFLSDLKHEHSKTGWSTLKNDKNGNDKQISMGIGGKREYFGKGIFAHAPSEVVYDIDGLKFQRLQGYFGIDLDAGNGDGVVMKLYADTPEKNLVPEDLKGKVVRRGEGYWFDVEVPAGTKKLYIGADKNGNDFSDWAVFGSLKLVKDTYNQSSVVKFKKISEYDNEIKQAGDVKNALATKEFEILKRDLIRRTGYYRLVDMMEAAGDKGVAVKWLMKDVKNLRGFLMAGEPEHEDWDKAIEILGRLVSKHEADLDDATSVLRKTKGDLYRRLMMAAAVALPRRACFWQERKVCSDPVERYEMFKELHGNGLLKKEIFETLEAEEMRWVVGSLIDNAQLKWLNYYARARRGKSKGDNLGRIDESTLVGVEPVLDPYAYIEYTQPNVYKKDEHYAADGQNWKDKYGFDRFGVPYGLESEYRNPKLWMVFELGAVCGGISHTGANLNAAFGIPASVNGQPGHAAYLQYNKNKDKKEKFEKIESGDYRAGEWGVGNNISGWAGSEKSERLLAGWGGKRGRTNIKELSEYNASYMLLAQANINRFENYMKAREIAMLAEVYASLDVSGSRWSMRVIENLPKVESDLENEGVVKAEEVYRELLKVAPIDFEGWKGLVVSYLKNKNRGKNDYVALAGEIAENLKEFPLPMADLIQILENAVVDNDLRVTIRGIRDAKLHEVERYDSKKLKADLLQPEVTGIMAKALLNIRQKEAIFSFDGENAGSIVLGPKYSGGTVRYEYSLDGKRTWKETSEKVHKLTREELEEINENDDILIHFIGDGGKFGGEGEGRLDPSNNEHNQKIYPIDIERHVESSAIVDELEDRPTGDTNILEWREVRDDTGVEGNALTDWAILDDKVRFTGNRFIEIRRASTNNKVHSYGVLLHFLENKQDEKRRYITLNRIDGASVSSEEANRDNGKNHAMDGDPRKIWHTAWHKTDNDRFIVLKLDKKAIVNGLEYLPRQDNGDNGNVLKFEISVSMTGKEGSYKPVTLLSPDTWENNKQWKKADFEGIEALYVKFRGVKTVRNHMSAAMIRLYEDATQWVEEPGTESGEQGENGGSSEQGGSDTGQSGGEQSGGSNGDEQKNTQGGNSSSSKETLESLRKEIEEHETERGDTSIADVNADENGVMDSGKKEEMQKVEKKAENVEMNGGKTPKIAIRIGGNNKRANESDAAQNRGNEETKKEEKVDEGRKVKEESRDDEKDGKQEVQAKDKNDRNDVSKKILTIVTIGSGIVGFAGVWFLAGRRKK